MHAFVHVVISRCPYSPDSLKLTYTPHDQVTTSRGRTQHFGSGNAQQFASEQGSGSWVCLSTKARTRVTGFVLDISKFRESGIFQDIGIAEVVETDDPGEALAIGEYYPELEVSDPRFTIGQDADPLEEHDLEYYYHSSGSLHNVARILTRKMSLPDGDFADLLEEEGYDRMVGLQIIHGNGLINTLGRWDPEGLESISEIYDVDRDGPLEVLEFRHPTMIAHHFGQIIARKRTDSDGHTQLPFVSTVFPHYTDTADLVEEVISFALYSPHDVSELYHLLLLL